MICKSHCLSGFQNLLTPDRLSVSRFLHFAAETHP
jgi:hypothetical protein